MEQATGATLEEAATGGGGVPEAFRLVAGTAEEASASGSEVHGSGGCILSSPGQYDFSLPLASISECIFVPSAPSFSPNLG